MILVNDYSEVILKSREVKSYKDGYITNFFANENSVLRWIENTGLYSITLGKTAFFVRNNGEFYNLYFFSPNLMELKDSIGDLLSENPSSVFVTDLVINDPSSQLKNTFEEMGFKEYTYLVRMSRLMFEPSLEIEDDVSLYDCTISQVDEVVGLFNKFFDPKAEQIPSRKEIVQWVESGTISIYEIEQKIAGFIIYDLIGSTLYLRYWFVHPDFREQRIGSKLFKYFLFKGRFTKRQLFWVIASNENAIKRYKHYGFSEEKLMNYIMINKDLRYEG